MPLLTHSGLHQHSNIFTSELAHAKERPMLMGWFTGQLMKTLGGATDPDEVMEKVAAKFVEK
jgi:Asp-tRNA(Asn)/Glu-tRNA(Gln) amidotransferase B subunit